MILSRLTALALVLAAPLACPSNVAAEPLRHGPPAQMFIATYVQPAAVDVAYRHHHRSRHHRRHYTRRG